ncbi:hypothetical protein [Acinetobacter sp.]|uniref:hypothetical protein n=1 Tax=Acinetobacter sp. TaxID=472 RepID=UPI00388E0D0E
MFEKTLGKHKGVSDKLKEFITFKMQDPMARFGKKDQHFTNNGILQATGMIHTHLTGDISLLYRRSGREPMVIDLVAVVTHDELGTGQPSNIKQQKKMVKVLNDLEYQ